MAFSLIAYRIARTAAAPRVRVRRCPLLAAGCVHILEVRVFGNTQIRRHRQLTLPYGRRLFGVDRD